MELGIYTFGEVALGEDGVQIEPARRISELLEEIQLADELGLDVFGVGEHHRAEYVVSSPATVLAAAAARTRRIRLSSAVTVLSSDDPVRVFQQFATVDLISNGRAEIMAGRGSFIESFPLFGYDLGEYDELFEEKLELLLRLREGHRVSWSGRRRPAIPGLSIYPQPVQQPLPVWVAVGGTPQSVVRAARLGLPMALAIIGGQPSRFKPMADLYRRAAAEANVPGASIRLSINSIGFLADTTQDAADLFFPGYASAFTRIGKERGWPPTTRSQYDASRAADGALVIGSPQEVIDKISREKELFGLDRFLLQMGVSSMPHDKLMRSIELLGTVVAPAVR